MGNLRKILSMILCLMFTFIMMPLSKVYASDSYIKDNAWVFGNSPNSNFGGTNNLVVGYTCHAYMRFDLTGINVDNVKQVNLNLTKYNNGSTIVINKSSEYLRDGSVDSVTKWSESNLTFNNRPLDVEGYPTVSQQVQYGEVKAQFDLTDILLQSKKAGENEVSIHITTTTVNDTSISGTDIYSTRSGDKSPYLEVISNNEELPKQLEATKSGDTYLDSGKLIQKIVKIKNADGKYLKLDNDGGIITTSNKDEAANFGVYVYDYTEYEYDGNGGAAETTYAIKCLDNNKYLTIQNYFEENASDKTYFNLVDGRYEVKATADEVRWHERFYINHYEQSDYYTISSHLNQMRDGSESDKSPLQTNDDMLYSVAGDRKKYEFKFENVTNKDPLEVRQKVSGNSVKLSWYPVNGDTNINNYKIDGANIALENGLLVSNINMLSVGEHKITVKYLGAEAQQVEVLVRVFSHPGVTHTFEELEAMKKHIENKEEPWYSDYQKLISTVPNNMASSDFAAATHEGVGRGNPEGHGNVSDYEQSGTAAYLNALQWIITGEDKYADAAVNILNAWANDLKVFDGRDAILGASLTTLKFNNAAEIMRYYNGGYKAYSQEDFEKYQALMENVIYPVIQDIGIPMNANGNWDIIPMMAMLSIGVVSDNTEIFDRAVNMYQDIHVNGSISAYVSEWGQTVESARDQAHGQLGVGVMGDICDIALNQGINLYKLYDNRLAKAFNWTAQYNLFSGEGELKTEPLTNVYGKTDMWAYWEEMDQLGIYRGDLRPIYEQALAYYSKVDGVDVTWMKKAAEATRSQGYVHMDNLNFGTLTSYNGESTETPAPYFQIRTRLTPWYQSTWNEVKKYSEVPSYSIKDGILPTMVSETLNSYFGVNENNEIQVNGKQATAPYFQLITNYDGTYSIKSVVNNKYLSIKDEIIDGENVIKADASQIGENEKFKLQSYGVCLYYLKSTKYDNRLVKINIENGEDPLKATLTLRLGQATAELNGDTKSENWFMFMYNTKEEALKGVLSLDKTELKSKIEEAEGLKEAEYTKETWTELSEKLTKAKEIISNESVTQEEIDKALSDLNTAIKGLEKVKPVENNKDIVGKAIDDGYVAKIDKSQIENLSNEDSVKISLGELSFEITVQMLKDFIGDNENATLEILKSSISDTKSKDVLKLVESGKVIETFNIELRNISSNGEITLIHELGKKIKLSLNLSEDKIKNITDINNAKLYYYDEQAGKLVDMNAVFDISAKTVTFETDHFSIYTIVQNENKTDDGNTGGSGNDDVDTDEQVNKNTDGGTNGESNKDENVADDGDSTTEQTTDKLVQTGSLIGLNSFMVLGFALLGFGYVFMKKRESIIK